MRGLGDRKKKKKKGKKKEQGRRSVFTGNRRIGDAQDLGNPNYWTPGKYRARLHRVVYRPSTNPRTPNAEFFIIECSVLDVLTDHNDDEDIVDEYGKSKKDGELVSHVIDLNKLPDLAAANVKNFASALLATEGLEDKLSEDDALELETQIEAREEGDEDADPYGLVAEISCDGDGQTFTGLEFIVNAVASRTSKDTPFTRVVYLSLSEDADEDETDEPDDEDEPEPEPPKKKKKKGKKKKKQAEEPEPEPRRRRRRRRE
jgi:hypothetical protein